MTFGASVCSSAAKASARWSISRQVSSPSSSTSPALSGQRCDADVFVGSHRGDDAGAPHRRDDAERFGEAIGDGHDG